MASYLKILEGKYPAKAHAKNVGQWIVGKGGDKNGVLYLEGQKLRMIEVCIAVLRDFHDTFFFLVLSFWF